MGLKLRGKVMAKMEIKKPWKVYILAEKEETEPRTPI